jgi:hypothetical protein
MAGVLTRDWEALEMADTIARNGYITVTGEVELTDTGTTAELKEHALPGADPKVLLLDLVIHRHGGIQGHVAWFETLTFKMKSSGGSYDEVAILYGGEIVRRVKVEHPLTFAAPRVAPSAIKAPGKTRAKAAAAIKKAGKKAAKKPARRIAKKSVTKPALKKTVRRSSAKRRFAAKSGES